MPASPAITATPVPATPFSGLSLSTASGKGQPQGDAAGLFLSLLGQNGITPLSPNPLLGTANGQPSAQILPSTQSTQGSSIKTGPEPALLVLPEGLTSLTEADLKAFIASQANGENTNLGNDFLIALTPGTPAAQAIANFLSQNGKGTIATSIPVESTGLPTTLPTELTTTMSNTTIDGQNMLLVATNLSPSDLEALKKFIKSSSDAANPSDSLPSAIAKSEDGTDATDTMAVALVMFAPTQFIKHIESSPVALSSESIASTSTTIPTTSMDSKTTGPTKRISPFALGDKDGILSTGGQLSGKTSAEGFQGSIASLDAAFAKSDAEKLIGKMDLPASLSAGNAPFPLTASFPADTSLLSAPALGTATTQSNLTNPVFTNTSAAMTHPTTQTIAMVVDRMASNATQNSKQTLSVQLDPVDLGRVQVQLSFERGEPMKVKLIAEKQDTLNMLQRDSHALKSTLEGAGIQMDGSSLSFDLASGDQAFNQMLGQFQDNNSQKQTTRFSLEGIAGAVDNDTLTAMDTAIDFTPDTYGGTVRYSILA